MSDILRQLADNEPLLEAVKEEVLKSFRLPLDFRNDAPNELLGQQYRARIEGAKLVESAFDLIARLKTRDIPTSRKNPAR